MPTYEYLCEANGRVLEVRHKMAERLKTWGELCARAGIPPGRTSPAAPVKKLISAGFIGTATASQDAAHGASCDAPGCGAGACVSGACDTGSCDWGDD